MLGLHMPIPEQLSSGDSEWQSGRHVQKASSLPTEPSQESLRNNFNCTDFLYLFCFLFYLCLIFSISFLLWPLDVFCSFPSSLEYKNRLLMEIFFSDLM